MNLQSQAQYNDGRGRYPDRITAGAPVGLRDLVKEAASAEGISLAEFVRQAIERRLARRIAGAAR